MTDDEAKKIADAITYAAAAPSAAVAVLDVCAALNEAKLAHMFVPSGGPSRPTVHVMRRTRFAPPTPEGERMLAEAAAPFLDDEPAPDQARMIAGLVSVLSAVAAELEKAIAAIEDDAAAYDDVASDSGPGCEHALDEFEGRVEAIDPSFVAGLQPLKIERGEPALEARIRELETEVERLRDVAGQEYGPPPAPHATRSSSGPWRCRKCGARLAEHDTAPASVPVCRGACRLGVDYTR